MVAPSYLSLEKKLVKSGSYWESDSLINHDLDHSKFFIKNHDSSIELIRNPSIGQYAINRSIYFKPSHCPLVTIHDSNEGTCFEDLYIPTGSYKFDLQRNEISISILEKNLSLDSYISTLHEKIKQKIHLVYQQNPVVNLCYSGGIDSMVLLSFIMELGFLYRTRIIVFENFTQTHPSCLHVNDNQKNFVTGLLDQIKSQCLGIRWHTITMQDLATAFNHGDLADIKCYATFSLLQHYHDEVFMIGHHGNQIFLHKAIFFDEIVIQQPDWKDRLESYISSRSGYYTASAAQYLVTEDLVGIERRHLLAKPWGKYNGFNNNKIYAPIADNDDFLMLRSLDFGRIHPDVIMEARVATEMIKLNKKGDISAFVGIESIKDNDNLEDARIPADLILPSSLDIPANLQHDPEGLEYIQNEIQQISNKKSLAINSAVSIKSLQHIASTYK